jgi:hypothetical protein
MRYGRLMIAAAAAVAWLGACGAAADDDAGVASLGGKSDSEKGGLTEEEIEQAFRDYDACMREQGIEIQIDEPGEDGEESQTQMDEPGEENEESQGTGGSTKGTSPEDLEKAEKECGKHLDGVVQGDPHQNMSPEERRKEEELALKYVKCMREHGIDMPDPTFDDGGSGGHSATIQDDELDDIDTGSEKFKRAMEDCEPIQREMHREEGDR